MSWQASYGDTEKINGRIRLYVDYTDGSTKVRREYDVTDKNENDIKKVIREEVKILNNQSSISNIKPGDIVDVSESSVDTEKKAFLEDLGRLKKMNMAVELGIKQSTDADFLYILDRVRSRFKEEYLNLL